MTKTLIISDDDLLLSSQDLPVISFRDYLTNYPKTSEPKTRVINLCDAEQYLSFGYYCSLLAEARQHLVLPSVSTINDLRNLMGDQDLLSELVLPNFDYSLDNKEAEKVFPIFFGWSENEKDKKLAKFIFSRFPTPILSVRLYQQEHGVSLAIQRIGFGQLSDHEKQLCLTQLQNFVQAEWRSGKKSKKHRWDLAILVDPDEANPPSDKDAISRFVKAGSKLGIAVEVITAKQAHLINEFDALFIRETTAIDHHTYRIARKAEREGLVVIDDPTSILRCCNKVFLHDAFTYNQVNAPRSKTLAGISDQELLDLENSFGYPMVLKMPEGSFSQGVYKVENRDELTTRLAELFEQSALVLVQEYLYTDFDWRIGVLNGRPIYACRYFMASNHWQIYDHGSTKKQNYGKYDAMPTFEVPSRVLHAARKASAIIGNGLYGVDIKQKDNQVYVIEVNDNPSIEHRVEDQYLGDDLYMLIMQEFLNRLEERGKR